MQANKFTTLVEIAAHIGNDAELFGVRLKSMFVDPDYKEESGQHFVKFACLCCQLNYVVSLAIEKEKTPPADIMAIDWDAEEEVLTEETPIIEPRDQSPTREATESENVPEPEKTPEEATDEEESEPEPPLPVLDRATMFKCGVCFKGFPSFASLGRHEYYTHRDFTCKVCKQKVSGGRYRLEYHLMVEHKIGLECPLCKELFPNAKSLTTHHLKHRETKDFKCDECSFETQYRKSLERHKKSHSIWNGDIKPDNVCHVCGRNYTTRSTLKVHLKVAHDIEDEEENKRLKRRKTKNTDVGEVVCDECGRNYPSAKTLRVHQYYCKRKDLKRYMCKQCDRGFPWPFELERHVKSVHTKEPFRCSQCGETFKGIRALYRHRSVVHKKKKKYECSDCQKVFHLKQHFVNHQRIHTGEKFKCPYVDCGREIADDGTFWKHKRKHRLNGDTLIEQLKSQ